MSNKQDFNNFFPTDNSASTNLKYDLVASKLVTGVENHQMRQYHNSQSTVFLFGMIGGIFQIIIGLIIFSFGLLRTIFKALSK